MVRRFVILQKWWMFLLLPLFAQQVTIPNLSLRIKNRTERIKLRFQTTKNLSCNTDLTIFELHTALFVIKHTSPDPDEITYSMLQHLSEHSLLNILYMFNRIWKEHVLPDCWKRAFIIPIPKPGVRILFPWVPSHVGITRNELADKSTKSATEFLTLSIVYADVRSAVNQWCHSQWQEKWNMETNNKIHVIKPVLSQWVIKLNRRCDVMLTRLRIGQTRLTHRHLLFAESPPTCSHCGGMLTLRHILTDCVALNRHRLRYFRSSSFNLSFLLGEIPHFNISMYLKGIGVFHDI
ncbi:hypothetical protein AVEN_231903-1 [Araneus ventricosus]|uniref:RNase H type-1 domain-containing protein n=1 Tax=Araneus ventricosus TaxID=182803 RepID=A0A4Y1ZJM4_ARAVE|nr:hypothetical protein AVEN_21494-1 [Araneus ventricosus]GBO47005.1 hypothetical protein AVEN_231903-1 [Araneus ventricosus]